MQSRPEVRGRLNHHDASAHLGKFNTSFFKNHDLSLPDVLLHAEYLTKKLDHVQLTLDLFWRVRIIDAYVGLPYSWLPGRI